MDWGLLGGTGLEIFVDGWGVMLLKKKMDCPPVDWGDGCCGRTVSLVLEEDGCCWLVGGWGRE